MKRNYAVLALISRKGAGAGKHKTPTRDLATGRKRRPKHGGKKALCRDH